MKVKRNFEKLKQCLIETNNTSNVILVFNRGKDNEEYYLDISNLKEENIPYFATLILKKGGLNKWKKFIS